VLDRIPHVPDEAAYLFNAKYLAAGKLTIPVPPVPEAFDVPFYANDQTRWFLTPPVGWPLTLALGFWIGAPWLINPLLGGLGLLLTHGLVERTNGPATAAGVTALLAISPWFLFMNASLMTHPLTLVLFLLAMLAIGHLREGGHVLWAVLAGLAVGGILHIRPLDAVIAAAIAGGWWLAAGLKHLRFKAVLATVVSGIMMAALFLAYNRALTGDPFQVPIGKYVDAKRYQGANRLGFGKDVGNFGWVGLDPLPGHGLSDVLVNANQNLYMTNFDLFGWPFGSLLLVFLLLSWNGRGRDALWWLSVLAVIAGLSLYWFSGGPDYSARYWYMIIPACGVLTLRATQTLIEKLKLAGSAAITEARLWMFVALASILGAAVLVPWRSLDKYKFYRGTRPDFRALIVANHWDQDLIFIRGRSVPDFISAAQFNPPRFDRDAPGPIFVLDVGPEKNRILAGYYSNRRVWVVEGLNKAATRVVAGPLAPGTAPPPPEK